MNSVVDTVLAKIAAAGTDRGLDGRDDVAELVRSTSPLLSGAGVDAAVADVRAGLHGLGPLTPILDDDSVTDVMINGGGEVWVDRGAGVERADLQMKPSDIAVLIERVLAPLSRRVDPMNPVVDARLTDGSRVHVVVPPLAVDGPCITIRRFTARRISLEDVAPTPVTELLRWFVHARSNVVVSGGTGSGKTTLLNALAAHVDPSERIITVEDSAELQLPGDHVVRLETRVASAEGVAAVDARELVRNALRMRPDRLLLGEVRGPEALDLIQAMNTGHDGSLSTVHANGCEDALRRLETLVLLAGIGLPLDAVREHLAAAVDVIVHVARRPTGERRVEAVAEVLPPSAGAARRIRVLAHGEALVARPERSARSHHVPDPPEVRS